MNLSFLLIIYVGLVLFVDRSQSSPEVELLNSLHSRAVTSLEKAPFLAGDYLNLMNLLNGRFPMVQRNWRELSRRLKNFKYWDEAERIVTEEIENYGSKEQTGHKEVESQLWFSKGAFLFHTGHYIKARNAFQAAFDAMKFLLDLETNKENPAVKELHEDRDSLLNYMTLCHVDTKNISGTIWWGEVALRYNPKSSVIFSNVARAHLIVRNEEEAWKVFYRGIFEEGLRELSLLESSLFQALKSASIDEALFIFHYIRHHYGLTSESEAHVLLHHSLFLPISLEERLKIAQIEGQKEAKACQGSQITHSPTKFSEKKKIRIGYFNSHFVVKHSSYFLTRHLFQYHNKEKFEVYVYFWQPIQAASFPREAMEPFFRHFDVVRNMSGVSANNIVKQIMEDEIEILIDYNTGQTNERPDVLCQRPAPIQIHHLGFAGTTGRPFLDYIVVDPSTAPEEQQQYFVENLIYMPYTYQVNSYRSSFIPDSPNLIDPQQQQQQQQTPFVFCNFNHYAKMNREMIASWTNILRGVPDSVFYVLKTGEESYKRVVKLFPEDVRHRLVPQPSLAKEEHLARLHTCHVGLDNWIYNGHTVGSDMWWGGIPVVVLEGEYGFSSRVGMGLARSMEMEEMITYSVEEYETVAIRLGRDVDFYNSIRKKVHSKRLVAPLFDTQKFVHHWEIALSKISSLFRNGHPLTNVNAF